jgi:hypothetical protein
VRPPTSVTGPLKTRILAAYANLGEPWEADQTAGDYELDHLISLELGGATGAHPGDDHNLWPQPYEGKATIANGAHLKDKLENALHEDVCSGRRTLADAQHAMASDWYAAYHAESPAAVIASNGGVDTGGG